jgi:hypothetical protein
VVAVESIMMVEILVPQELVVLAVVVMEIITA